MVAILPQCDRLARLSIRVDYETEEDLAHEFLGALVRSLQGLFARRDIALTISSEINVASQRSNHTIKDDGRNTGTRG